MQRYCLALDLKDDPALIAEYRRYHAAVWPDIQRSIRRAGVLAMEIYLIGNRLFMVLDADDAFTFERKNAMDAANPAVQEWEQLMWRFQQALPGAPPGSKWQLMEKVFALQDGAVLPANPPRLDAAAVHHPADRV